MVCRGGPGQLHIQSLKYCKAPREILTARITSPGASLPADLTVRSAPGLPLGTRNRVRRAVRVKHTRQDERSMRQVDIRMADRIARPAWRAGAMLAVLVLFVLAAVGCHGV